MPLQPFFVKPDVMSGQASSSSCRCGGARDLGAEQEHPSYTEPIIKARRAPCMDFSQKAFPEQLSPLYVLLNV